LSGGGGQLKFLTYECRNYVHHLVEIWISSLGVHWKVGGSWKLYEWFGRGGWEKKKRGGGGVQTLNIGNEENKCLVVCKHILNPYKLCGHYNILE
jgi:hypothetical protein